MAPFIGQRAFQVFIQVPAQSADSVVALQATDFYKSMASEMRPGTWQDVYRPVYLGIPLYVKLQLTPARLVVVISFKEL